MYTMKENVREIVKENCKYCIICGRVNKAVSVHLFPKDVSIKTKWAAYCGMEIHEIKSKHSLCAKHFAPCYFKKLKNCSRLKFGAVPSILIQNEIKETKQPRCGSCVLCGGSMDPNLRYHSFPKDTLNRSKWAEFCDMALEHIKNGQKLCNKHFTTNCFDRKRRLLSNSVPSLFKLDQNLDESTKIQNEIHTNIPDEKYTNVPEDNTNFLDQNNPESKFTNAVNIPQPLSEYTKNTEVGQCVSLAEHNYSSPFNSTSNKILEVNKRADIQDCIISTTPTEILTNTTPKIRRSNIRYLGDLRSLDLQQITGRNLQKFYSLVHQKLTEKNKIIRAAKQRQRRTTERLKNLQELIIKLKDKNMIHSTAAVHLIRFINNFGNIKSNHEC